MKTKRVFIGIFGRKNQGKSSLINALTRQDIAIVSPVAGTTTDPVKKSMEIFGIGPVVLIDTAGVDDDSILGQQRVSKTLNTVSTIDVAIVVVSHNEFTDYEKQICSRLKEHNVPFLFVYNKNDIEPRLYLFHFAIMANRSREIVRRHSSCSLHSRMQRW